MTYALTSFDIEKLPHRKQVLLALTAAKEALYLVELSHIDQINNLVSLVEAYIIGKVDAAKCEHEADLFYRSSVFSTANHDHKNLLSSFIYAALAAEPMNSPVRVSIACGFASSSFPSRQERLAAVARHSNLYDQFLNGDRIFEEVFLK